MSLRAIPLLAIAFILYNLIALAGLPLDKTIFSVPMVSKNPDGTAILWRFTWSDFIILVTMLLLFVEILKSTYTSTSSLVDHALSMLVFVACLIEFLLVGKAANSAFFFILVATLIDVIAGFTIGIRVAKRDIGFGTGGDN
jgi:hypothetical protein